MESFCVHGAGGFRRHHSSTRAVRAREGYEPRSNLSRRHMMFLHGTCPGDLSHANFARSCVMRIKAIESSAALANRAESIRPA